MTVDRARQHAATAAGAAFLLLLMAHPSLAARAAIWPVASASVAAVAAALWLTARVSGRHSPGGQPSESQTPPESQTPSLAPSDCRSSGARLPAGYLPRAAGLAYLAATALSVALSPAPAIRLVEPTAQMALVWVGWWLGPSVAARRRLARVAVAGAAFAGLYGLIQLAGLDPIPPAEDFADRLLSTFPNPNHFGDFAAAVLPLATVAFLWSALRPGTAGAVPRGCAWRLAGVGAIYAGLLLAGSRGAYWAFGAAGSLLVVALWSDSRSGHLVLRRGPLLAVLATILAVTLALHRTPVMKGPSGPVTLAQRVGASAAVLDGGAGDSTLGHRRFLWRAALEMIEQDPVVGAGYGQFAARLSEVRLQLRRHPSFVGLRPSQQREITPYAHNELLHLWAETGLVGTVAFLALVGLGVQTLYGALADPARRSAAWASGAAGSALLVHGLVSYPLHMEVSAFLFWILLGIIFSLKTGANHADEFH